MNFGMSEEDAKERAHKVLNLVGLDESYLEKSPFELSGGQKEGWLLQVYLQWSQIFLY